MHLFDALDYLAELTRHIPPRRASHLREASAPEDPGFEPLDEGEEITVNARKRVARLLAKAYEIDPLVCPKCGCEDEGFPRTRYRRRKSTRVRHWMPRLCEHLLSRTWQTA